MRHKHRYFNVAPRYTPGSPAQVDFDTATRVVDEERRAYEYTLAGARSPDVARQAALDGLAGIVEERLEKADCWVVTDMITGRKFVRMFPAQEDERKRRLRAFRLRAKYRLEVEDSQ